MTAPGESASGDAARAARPVCATVDLTAITHNLEQVRRLAVRPVQVIAPIKANAYGHGSEAVGMHLERIGVDAVATANVEEAVALRRAGARLPILMYASQLPHGIAHLLSHELTPTIHDRAGLDAAAAAAGTRPVAVHVEVDGGFGRLGVRLDEAADFLRVVAAEKRVHLEGVYTHLPFGDEIGASWARRRLAAFTALIRGIETEHAMSIRYAQAMASSGLLTELDDELNTVSPGHLLYGLSPLGPELLESWGLRAAMSSLTAQLIHIGRRESGDDLHGGPSVTARRTGVILLGIDNGMRFAPEMWALVRGARAEILSVTAEYTVLDVTAVPSAEVGDMATVVGRDGRERITVEQVAAWQGCSAGYWMMGLRRVPLAHG